jgi:hypothetical protein
VTVDPLAAFCAFLRAQPAVSSLLDQIPPGFGLPQGVPAVFRPDLPQNVDASMPLACIVVRPAGGYTQYGKGMLPLADPRIDLICFASNQSRATQIAQTAASAVKQLARPQTWEGTTLYGADVHAGPVPLPDQQTLWPACWLSVVLLHGELPAPVQ